MIGLEDVSKVYSEDKLPLSDDATLAAWSRPSSSSSRADAQEHARDPYSPLLVVQACRQSDEDDDS